VDAGVSVPVPCWNLRLSMPPTTDPKRDETREAPRLPPGFVYGRWQVQVWEYTHREYIAQDGELLMQLQANL
jgi:hypothetical protein